MSRPDDTAPVEHDPTGMRALLSSLPDPAPMPPDLVARISAALAAEAGRESGVDRLWHLHEEPDPDTVPGDADDGAADDGARVLPLRRRVRARHLGVAAAVVGVLGLGGLALQQLPGGSAMSSMAGGASDSGTDTRSGAAAAEGGSGGAGAKADAAPEVAPAAGSGEVVVVMSGVDHDSSRLAVTARELDDGTLDPVTDLTAESPSIGPIATPIGARACADSLGIPADAGILVDVSEVDGISAAVLVVHDANGRSAWAVERSCPNGPTDLIRGPVPLD